MATGVNRVILVGNLGADPEMRTTQSGKDVARIRLATTEAFKRPDGGLEKRTEWHTLIAWGKRAQVVGEYLKKGRQIYAEGKLKSRKWTDKEGKTRFSTEVVADRITFLGGPRGGNGQQYSNVADADEETVEEGQQQEEMPF